MLQAHRPHRGRRRADEDDAGGGAGFGEGRVLGEEAVARVDRIGARVARGLDDRCGVQVGLARGRRPDGARLVGEPHVQRAAIGLRVHGDRVHAEPAAGPDHAAGDLAAIRDQQPLDLHSSRIQPGLRRSRKAVSPSRASAPARTRAIQRVVSVIMDSSAGGAAAGHAVHEPLDLGLRPRAAGEQRVTIACVASRQRRIVHGLVHESDAHRGRGVHGLAGQEPAPRLALPDGADHVGRDHRRDQPEPDLGERESRARCRQARCRRRR